MVGHVHVALSSAPFSTLTYGIPDHLAGCAFPPGLRVLVPLGKSIRAGVVMESGVPPPEGVQTRPLVWPLEREPLFDAAYLDMIRNLASRQMASPGQVLGRILPAGLRQSKVVFSAPRQGRVLRATPRSLLEMAGDEAAFWAGAWTEGAMLAGEAAGPGRARERVLRLLVDPPWPVRPGAKARLALLDFLLERGQVPLGVVSGHFGRDMGPAIRALGSLGLVEIGAAPSATDPEETPPDEIAPCPPEALGAPLTDEQTVALRELSKALCVGTGQVRLVHGVTGSGKTRLYLELARECLNQGRQAFLLAPEVALAGHLHRAVREAFPGVGVALYHGSLSPSAREAAFRRAAASREPVVVVGTRSALFLPAPNPGLFVLDEEHDASFKQEERLGYQAKEVAFFRARLAGALLVLGSATPDVKTYHAAMRGVVPAVVLTRRVGASVPPDIEIVDLGKGVKTPSRRTGPHGDTSLERAAVLAEQSALALGEAVIRGEQAIILLNRRGYAPVLFCLDCEKVLACPDCDLAYTFHRGRQKLVCHYCGRTEDFPVPCASCGGSSFLPLGAGSESLEEELGGLLPPGTRVARLDRDSAARPGRAEEILADFAAGRSQVLAGTQMLSKGHHFPKVTLVIAADADMGRNLPDYRAAERTFQLLVQVAGRAGRGDRPGRVLVQTRNPLDPFWELVRRADYQGFFQEEMRRRERWLYPPFTKLGLVRVSFPKDCEEGFRVLAELGRALRAGVAAAGKDSRELRVLGPAPASLPLIGGRRRFHCLLKAPDWPAIRRLFAAVQAVVPRGGEVRATLDLDPVDML
ncbi:replication restart helicase PriA [Desulfolutivibrio sulfoxidireducens]|uniref:replication restart helicase PriA n=1 Tax=Desulfolutivibrio sulfoxidireducens TaxID=2773299 RepID=UPI00159DFDD8|nr:primosomal protein N' [Desulfolutivibrio sulfoxidireducens]QLA16980.1 primosomal protein N' [Desulfolutivibrio sulfoxidireducens]